MSSYTLTDFLRQSGVINQLMAEEIASLFKPVNFVKNDFFVKEGTVSNEYMFIENGFMRAFATDVDGNDITTNFYTANQVAFEVSSFFNRTRSQENIQCLTNVDGQVLTFDGLNTLFHALPAFREFGRLMLVRGFSKLKSRMLSMITETAEQRYLGLVADSPQILNFAPLRHVATYLGVTDTSLSRIRRELSHK